MEHPWLFLHLPCTFLEPGTERDSCRAFFCGLICCERESVDVAALQEGLVYSSLQNEVKADFPKFWWEELNSFHRQFWSQGRYIKSL